MAHASAFSAFRMSSSVLSGQPTTRVDTLVDGLPIDGWLSTASYSAFQTVFSAHFYILLQIVVKPAGPRWRPAKPADAQLSPSDTRGDVPGRVVDVVVDLASRPVESHRRPLIDPSVSLASLGSHQEETSRAGSDTWPRRAQSIFTHHRG